MGRGMVDNLMQAGFDLTVWNRTAAHMDPFVERFQQAVRGLGYEAGDDAAT